MDPEFFEGTCYKAANWTVVGSSQGFARQAADFYQHHGKPKTILMYPLRQDFKELLYREELPEPYHGSCQQQQKRYPRLAEGKAIGSLMEGFGLLEDRRERKGRRYRLSGLLGVVVCGYVAGCRSLEQCAAFAAALNQRQCRSFGFWRAPGTGKLVAPSHTTLWRAICAAQPEAFDKVVETWLRQHQHDAPQAIAIDGKVIRATATPANPEALSVSAISHSLRVFFSATFASGERTTSRRPSSICSARSVRSMERP
ncbi:MAG: transposase family protein [Candidatus Synoicihabitans palmerolidicus]|nr:transposase family protein [Candidatus Synoicihabitans palmerolidicus]